MGSGDYVLLWIIPIVFISLLLLELQNSIQNQPQKSSSKHKTIPDFTYQNLKGGSFQ
jgi:hypothetical protein